MNSNTVQKVYNNYASFYDILFSRIFDPARLKAIKQMEIKPDHELIEIGIGTGLSFKSYSEIGNVSITGIDLSEKMLKKAKQKAVDYKNLNISLDCIDGENTPYKDASFDKVVMMYVYSVTPNPEKLIKEAIRICKDDGSIHIINHFSNYKKSKLNIFEKSLRNLSNLVGFRSDFSYVDHIENLKLNIENVESANIFSLTKIVHLKKIKNIHLLNWN